MRWVATAGVANGLQEQRQALRLSHFGYHFSNTETTKPAILCPVWPTRIFVPTSTVTLVEQGSYLRT